MRDQPDRGGRSVNLAKRAQRLWRRHGEAWLAELERQAHLGDVAALQTLLALAQLPVHGNSRPSD
ncbi:MULTISPECIES: hypothetical protein [Thiorhodovibrio]|uniref:hypothetical protein n=1 Tax=Thiorhodovibrio TaxID=61593 RepID=UPI001913AE3B|nr:MULTISPECIES: hypothetical protein [Thiorhodovibrio]MBK5969037.1 hypothetical protein [Thiorhodovibrio winogradskyi]WPL15082.1 hypothetical protein Thiosp_04946 [Thiorhodovibrio litoralis]